MSSEAAVHIPENLKKADDKVADSAGSFTDLKESHKHEEHHEHNFANVKLVESEYVNLKTSEEEKNDHQGKQPELEEKKEEAKAVDNKESEKSSLSEEEVEEAKIPGNRIEEPVIKPDGGRNYFQEYKSKVVKAAQNINKTTAALGIAIAGLVVIGSLIKSKKR